MEKEDSHASWSVFLVHISVPTMHDIAQDLAVQC